MRHLKVDPTRCNGYGLCAGLVPERIVRDDWGYPIVDARPIPAHLVPFAKRAVRECPLAALSLVDAPEQGRGTRGYLSRGW